MAPQCPIVLKSQFKWDYSVDEAFLASIFCQE
ncbi:hypothetical protein HG66A1_23890 [Gimesia chilikensis]|jgi:hypothetical protein|uniref:Uncharacterized protein n=1 Tax=Gimesia chilikensis TaxID=2605989 RepID=A0A517PMJ6_9PLAN|nr:hypothetical protein HG66A1_23890 [Gimesia chilikensis]QDT85008.1 hypothetical protein MalM14_26730 [Gimesia chilikensis]